MPFSLPHPPYLLQKLASVTYCVSCPEHVQQIQSQGSEQLALLRFVGLSGHLGVVSQGPGGPDTAKWYFMKIMNRANHNPG